jgi:hypothetical protein
LEVVLPVRFVPRLYNEGYLPLRESLETAVKIVGDWCEMAANLRGRGPGEQRNVYCWETLPSNAMNTVTVCDNGVNCSHGMCVEVSIISLPI